jgi:hypothetical protein
VVIELFEVLQMFDKDGFVVIRKEGDITPSARSPFINATLYLIVAAVINLNGTVLTYWTGLTAVRISANPASGIGL